MAYLYSALQVHKSSVADKAQYNLILEQLPFSNINLACDHKDQVLIKVHYSGVNYKDLMSCGGHPAITRRFPHTPGIDAAGMVIASNSERFKSGDLAIVVCQPMGLNTPGGFAEYVRVPDSWLERLPAGISLKDSMVYGTAGFTAALAVEYLQSMSQSLKGRRVAVTGATGGLGALAIGMLARLGYEVTAISSASETNPFLKGIGAHHVLSRNALVDGATQNLLNPRFDAVIDVAGGRLLAELLKLLHESGLAIATGMVGGTDLPTNVLPFILRGISLKGINAESTSFTHRESIWTKIVSEYMPPNLHDFFQTVSLLQLPAILKEWLEKSHEKTAIEKPLGRVLIKIVDEYS